MARPGLGMNDEDSDDEYENPRGKLRKMMKGLSQSAGGDTQSLFMQIMLNEKQS
jgi:hypothetical protein